MAKVKLRGHKRIVEVVEGKAARFAPRGNLLQMLEQEGRITKRRVPWFERWWRRVARFFATVWACIRGRPSKRYGTHRP